MSLREQKERNNKIKIWTIFIVLAVILIGIALIGTFVALESYVVSQDIQDIKESIHSLQTVINSWEN